MNETIDKYIYEYDGFEFTLTIPNYWRNIYKGQPRKKLYHDYCVMLDLVKKIDKEKWVVDVGVNNGLFSVPACMMGYCVIGFEPIIKTLRNLYTACDENRLRNFWLFNYALSNENGVTDIYVPECHDNASLSKDAAIANMKHKEYEVQQVETIRFDDWLKTQTWIKQPFKEKIGFIKIDVQGHEVEVIEGMKEFLTDAHDIYIICEYEDHLLKQGHTFEELDELFKSYGFVEQPKILPNDKLWFKK